MRTAQALLVLDHKFSLCSSRCKSKSDRFKVSLVKHLEWIKKSQTVFWWPPFVRLQNNSLWSLHTSEQARECRNRKNLHWETAGSNNLQLQLLVPRTHVPQSNGAVYSQGMLR